MTLPKIFCFVNSGKGTDWQVVTALSEDGEFLASHVSSSEHFARLDIGCDGDDWSGKRALYSERYPDGFDLVWVADPRAHAGLMAAYALHKKAGPDGTPWQQARGATEQPPNGTEPDR